MRKLMTLSLLCAATLSNAANPGHKHTDGIEPYYHPKDTQAYLNKLSPEDRKAMFATEAEMKWWKDAKFGLFYCWGPSSMLECSLGWGRKGPRPQHSTDGKVTRGVPQEIYDNQYKKLEAPNFDADKLVKTVKDSGAKYLVWLTKHHDGFCVFDTKLTDYNIMNTPFGRDATKEIVDACHKYSIKIALYYSQPDWYNPIYASGDNNKYCDEYLFPQIRELLTKYGKIDVLWFDGLGRHPDTWKAPKLIKMVRELQPGIIVNHRFAHPPMHMGDFDGPERSIGRFQTNRPWETCTVIGGGWAWMGERPAMSQRDLVGLLTRCASNGGNLALGVGPRGTGEFIPDHKKRLDAIGDWMKQYGQTIRATQGGPYISGAWGGSTHKDNKVYLHILADWEGNITLPALPAKVTASKLLTGGAVNVKQTDTGLQIFVDKKNLDPNNTLVELTLDGPASAIKPIVTNGVSLSIGAQAIASSEYDEKYKASSVVASSAKEFSEGIFVRSMWRPANTDKKPWIQLTTAQPISIDQVAIREGRFGQPSAVIEFDLDAQINGEWKTLYTGTGIGGNYNLLLDSVVTSDTFRLVFKKHKGALAINSINLIKMK